MPPTLKGTPQYGDGIGWRVGVDARAGSLMRLEGRKGSDALRRTGYGNDTRRSYNKALRSLQQ